MSRTRLATHSLNPYLVRGEEIKPKDTFCYKVVVVIHPDGSWTAFKGNPDFSDGRIVKTGMPIDEEAATSLFPVIAHKRLYVL
jgi:hypothetical protein